MPHPGGQITTFTFDFDHGKQLQLADNYQAWALDGDDLVRYLPAERGPGGVPPGLITPRLPLAEFAPILREKGCPTATTTPPG